MFAPVRVPLSQPAARKAMLVDRPPPHSLFASSHSFRIKPREISSQRWLRLLPTPVDASHPSGRRASVQTVAVRLRASVWFDSGVQSGGQARAIAFRPAMAVGTYAGVPLDSDATLPPAAHLPGRSLAENSAIVLPP